jgi:hypothetical protein
MEKIAVFVNDVSYARHILQPLLGGEGPVHWIIVACPPTLSRHIGRWVSRGAREQWRQRWAAECFADVEPELKANPRNKLEKVLANRSPMDMASRLEARLGSVRLLDARRPRVGKAEEPLTAAQPNAKPGWTLPLAATTGLSAMLSLAD